MQKVNPQQNTSVTPKTSREGGKAAREMDLVSGTPRADNQQSFHQSTKERLQTILDKYKVKDNRADHPTVDDDVDGVDLMSKNAVQASPTAQSARVLQLESEVDRLKTMLFNSMSICYQF